MVGLASWRPDLEVFSHPPARVYFLGFLILCAIFKWEISLKKLPCLSCHIKI